ncbi:hypothetical protein DHD05_00655 [Arenibacter sp. N53]|nr:hypothetical protein [Arenibacter sp. N53]
MKRYPFILNLLFQIKFENLKGQCCKNHKYGNSYHSQKNYAYSFNICSNHSGGVRVNLVYVDHTIVFFAMEIIIIEQYLCESIQIS